MTKQTRTGLRDQPPRDRVGRDHMWKVMWLGLTMAVLSGCGGGEPSATVEGTLRLHGKPLDNCLVTFLPDSEQEDAGPHSSGLTDRQGVYRLRIDNQREGAVVGWHRVTVQDLSVSTGVQRRDNGAEDMGLEDTPVRAEVRPSRIPESYLSAARSPFRKEVKEGHQTIDLEIK